MVLLYNTLTKKVEEFKPLNPPMVTYYSCGPTVYDYAHIGHARTYIFADILERVLVFNGYKVKRVMNITDVGHLTSDADVGEDKMELASRRSGKGAAREKKSVWDIAKFYTDDFFDMLVKLNIKKPQIICRATDSVTGMIRIIEVLEKKGFTYKIEDGIYFDTSRFPQYGQLTGQTFGELQKTLKAGARVEVVKGKKHPTDFALWKFSYLGGRSFDSAQDDVASQRQMEWDSPWGRGFPGWHIECSTMSMDNLGETIDIHTGGADHIPIHHTNEIAQSEAYSGKQFVRFWLHADHLLADGQKMSKSLGNFYRIADIEKKKFSPLTLRYLFLTASYRSQMNFTWKSLEGAERAFDALCTQITNYKLQITNKTRTVLSEEKLEKVDKFRQEFTDAVNDDLNTAKGLAIAREVVKSNIPAEDKYDLLLLFDEVLGLNLKMSDVNPPAGGQMSDVPEKIKQLAEKREQLRREKKWEEADKIRQEIEKRGFTIDDMAAGSQIRSIK